MKTRGRRIRSPSLCLVVCSAFFLSFRWIGRALVKKSRVVDTLLLVSHPNDESIFGAEVLGEKTHVIVVTDANSGKNDGRLRQQCLKRAMRIVRASWETWTFPETADYRPSNSEGWSLCMQLKLEQRITKVFEDFPTTRRIVTHNALGEDGHIDHINLHKAVVSVVETHRSQGKKVPKLEFFMPKLNYSDYVDRLRYPPSTCDVGKIRASLLREYERCGGLENMHLFERLCYDYTTFNTMVEMTGENHFQWRSHEDIVLHEPDDVDAFWHANEDRKFMMSFYSSLTRFGRVLDIGVRAYNERCKALIGSDDVQYVQLEPRPPAKMKNDGFMHCTVQEAPTQYPQYQSYFDIILDFGVLGWESIDMSEDDIALYVSSVKSMLRENGIFVFKHGKKPSNRVRRAVSELRILKSCDYSPQFPDGVEASESEIVSFHCL